MDLLPDVDGSESESQGGESAADGMDEAVDRSVINVGTRLSLPHVVGQCLGDDKMRCTTDMLHLR